jgi:hypothetical protein
MAVQTTSTPLIASAKKATATTAVIAIQTQLTHIQVRRKSYLRIQRPLTTL